MSKTSQNRKTKTTPGAAAFRKVISIGLERLEDRRLLSASGLGGGDHRARGGFDNGFDGGFDRGFDGGPGGKQTIAFSLAPTAVQTGLDNLAKADGLTDPTSTQLVSLDNVDGTETYSVTLDGTGTVSKLTVDPLGDAVDAATHATTTWETLGGTGTGSDSAAATEISAIATALDLGAPASTDTVNIRTASDGGITYTINLPDDGKMQDNTDLVYYTREVTVDAAGNPVGDQHLPFSVIPTTIQNGLNRNAPTGATAQASTATQLVHVTTIDGVTTYTTTFTASGTQTSVTVDIAGKLTSLPSTTTTTFSALSSTVQTELQTLATADGVTTAIASNQSVSVLTETNGTILYGATLTATGTDTGGSTYAFEVTVTTDANGDPTVLPRDGDGGFGFGNGGFGFGGADGGGDCGSGSSDTGTGSNSSSGTNSNTSTGSNSNSSGGTTITPPASNSSSGSSNTLGSASAYSVSAKVLTNATSGLGMLGGYFVEFAPASVSTTVAADLTNIRTDRTTLAIDTKALTKVERATLKSDSKAITAAIKVAGSSITALEQTLKADAATWKATLRKDELAIRSDRKDATALPAAKSQLATDQTAAFAAIADDQSAIQTAINSNSGVVTARAQLASDLPTIAADESAITADQSQLVSDIESQSSAK